MYTRANVEKMANSQVRLDARSDSSHITWAIVVHTPPVQYYT